MLMVVVVEMKVMVMGNVLVKTLLMGKVMGVVWGYVACEEFQLDVVQVARLADIWGLVDPWEQVDQCVECLDAMVESMLAYDFPKIVDLHSHGSRMQPTTIGH